MENRVRERLVGALVLVAAVVLLVPALLRGPRERQDAVPAPETKSVEVTLGDSAPGGSDDALVPEPVPPPGPPPVPAADSPPGGAQPAAPAPTPPPAEGPASATAGAGGSPAWAVQLGAFSTREKAEGLVADLRKRGYAAFVLEYRANGQVLHRVRVGPEQDRARAVAIAERLRKDGFQPVVAPHP